MGGRRVPVSLLLASVLRQWWKRERTWMYEVVVLGGRREGGGRSEVVGWLMCMLIK